MWIAIIPYETNSTLVCINLLPISFGCHDSRSLEN